VVGKAKLNMGVEIGFANIPKMVLVVGLAFVVSMLLTVSAVRIDTNSPRTYSNVIEGDASPGGGSFDQTIFLQK
jgi:accessory gene regulator protein AgrB